MDMGRLQDVRQRISRATVAVDEARAPGRIFRDARQRLHRGRRPGSRRQGRRILCRRRHHRRLPDGNGVARRKLRRERTLSTAGRRFAGGSPPGPRNEQWSDRMSRGALSREEIRQRVDALGPWFHNLDLNGVPTAPSHFLGDYPNVKWRRFSGIIPDRLEGKTVLDIGCNAGFYAMEMKRRGAERVLGLDTDDEYLAQARFAAEVNGLRIEFRKMSAYDVGQLREKFDLVIFMGVLYHL